jgi:hypothetical protein
MIYYKFRRASQKTALYFIKLLSNKEDRQHTTYGRECISICRALISNEDSLLLISPISGKRYIKSDDDQIFIIIESTQVTIVNHHYSYNIEIWGKSLDRITTMFDHEVEKRRAHMEIEITSNVKHSLSSIYKNLVHEKKS